MPPAENGRVLAAAGRIEAHGGHMKLLPAALFPTLLRSKNPVRFDNLKFGAPPHGGIAFGFDRFCALFGGQETIRDYIAFPKNNAGRDMMLDAPGKIDESQMEELFLKSTLKKQN